MQTYGAACHNDGATRSDPRQVQRIDCNSSVLFGVLPVLSRIAFKISEPVQYVLTVYVRKGFQRTGVPIEHAAFVHSQPATGRHTTEQQAPHSSRQFSAVEAPCARCWRTCAHGDLQHWSPMQEQQGVYVCRASLSSKRGALCSLMNSSSRSRSRIWLTPHLPPAPATHAVRYSMLLWSCYAACTAHHLIGAQERRALEQSSVSTR